MITIIYSDTSKWPLQIESAKDCGPELATPDVRAVTCDGEDLELAHLELTGLPMPKYLKDWIGNGGFTWWWTDAVTVVNNIRNAYIVNKKSVSPIGGK